MPFGILCINLPCCFSAMAQVILLCVGNLDRTNHQAIANLSRSSLYLNAVSNRLSASVPRARILGMVVGTAISRLVETPEKAMNFDLEEMSGEEIYFLAWSCKCKR